MVREMMDSYLDGALDAGGRLEVESALTQDAAAEKLLATIKAERALRAAVYASYVPSAAEASGFAAQMLAACEEEAAAPVGRVGMWSHMRRYAAVAAMIVVAAGSFLMGRSTAPVTTVEVPGDTHTVYNLAYTDSMGSPLVREFGSSDERDKFFADQSKQNNGFAQLADFTTPGHM